METAARADARGRERAVRACDDRVRRRVGAEGVERLGRGDAEPAALAGRERPEAVVPAECVSLLVDDRAVGVPEAVPDEARAVVVPREEARFLAFRLLSNPGDASDVVQEVLLKVFRNVGHFRRQSSLKTWIYRINVNEAHNQRRWYFRHRSRELGLDEETDEGCSRTVADTGRSPFDYAFDREKHELIENALARINPLFREVVVLRDIEDLSYEEIAEVLQISLGTVKSRIMRGREALREELTGRLEAEPTWRLAAE